MAYYCKDCSYRGITSGQGGECPACGSYRIHRETAVTEKKKPPGKLRPILLVILWAYLIVHLIWKLNP
jgi:hypothetical protein